VFCSTLFKGLKGNKGFTLTELTVAVAITAIIMIPVYQVYFSGWNITANSLKQSDIQNGAVNLLEQLQHGFAFQSLVYGGLLELGDASQLVIDNTNDNATRLAYVARSRGDGNGYVVSYFWANGRVYRNLASGAYAGGQLQTGDIDDHIKPSSEIIAGDDVKRPRGYVQKFHLHGADGLLDIEILAGIDDDVYRRSTLHIKTQISPRNMGLPGI
jgi:prepilin-type N-terminal cleavage/methylation domain-containing protein